jgi:hypothetical protein
MTHNELLDTILTAYNWAEIMKIKKDPKYKKLTFNLVARAIEPTIEDWHIEYLRNRLFNDGFLSYSKFGDGEPFEITPDGIKASQANWYRSNAEDKKVEKETKIENLKSLKRSKTALWISVFAFIIPSIISVYTILTNKELPTKEQFQELQERIKKLENSKIEDKTISNALEEISIDSLK